MKILHIIGAFDKKLGGTYSAIRSIMKIENMLGHKNEILSLISKKQEYDEEFIGRVNLFKSSFPYLFNNSADADSWLMVNIHKYNFIVIHEVWGATAIKAARLAYKNAIDYAIWPHGSLDPFDLQKKGLLKKYVGSALVKNITRRANAICCTSQLEAEQLQTYNQHNSNIQILPLPINYDVKGNRALFRNKYNFKDQDIVFLFLSRIDYKKGLDLFLTALQQLVDVSASYKVKLLIAGKGTATYEKYIKWLIADLNLEGRVIISGFLTGSEKADAYAGADCFVLPSMNENYGISIIEALQADLPVLISDNVYIWKDIMPEGGWLCKHEVVSIYARLLEICSALRGNQPNNKKPAIAGGKFDQKALMPAYTEFYKRVICHQIPVLGPLTLQY